MLSCLTLGKLPIYIYTQILLLAWIQTYLQACLHNVYTVFTQCLHIFTSNAFKTMHSIQIAVTVRCNLVTAVYSDGSI